MNRDCRVIRCQPFSDPQAPRVDLVLVVERTQLDWAQPFHVPRVKQLVTHQRQPCDVPARVTHLPPARHQHRRVLVFDAAPRLGDEVEKQIPVVREEPPYSTLRLDDSFDIGCGACAVPHTAVADVDEKMRHSGDGEFVDVRVPPR